MQNYHNRHHMGDFSAIFQLVKLIEDQLCQEVSDLISVNC
jgi:hypothetical protein